MAVLSREQARNVDRAAMEDLAIPGIVLMENAARGIADIVLAQSASHSGCVAIVCGPGNNGGDGYAAARHLANAGIDVCLFPLVDPGAYRDGSDAAVNLAIARNMGLRFESNLDLRDTTCVLDAMFGTGLERPLRGEFEAAVGRINSSRAVVVAVDIPSGLDADSGAVHGVAVRADVTATMVAPKAGFDRGEGPAHVGRVEVVDIGVPPALVARIASA